MKSRVVFEERFKGSTVVPRLEMEGEPTEETVRRLAGMDGWHLVLAFGGRAESWIEDGAARVTVGAAGSIWYAVQLCYLPVSLESGKSYLASFEARAEAERRMTLDIAHVGGDWLSYSGRIEYLLSPEWREYLCAFKVASATNPRARFEFNVGCDTPAAFFRALRIVELPSR